MLGDVYMPRAVDRLGAVARVPAGRWAHVAAGYVWLVLGDVLVVDGVLRLDGVVMVGLTASGAAGVVTVPVPSGAAVLVVDGLMRLDGVVSVSLR